MYDDFEDKFKYNHDETCNAPRNMHSGNPHYRKLEDMQREKNEIRKGNFVTVRGESVHRHASDPVVIENNRRCMEIENSMRKWNGKKPVTVYNFCDGQFHYKSFGTDPTYMVKCYCPLHWAELERANPDIKRGRL